MALDKWCSLEQQPMNDSSRSNDHYEPSDLTLGCTIFLSHSGKDKNFVSILHQALHCRGYKVFFDKEVLPKGAPVSMDNILGEIKNYCKLGVLVLSDDFFELTRNPMLELAAFVEHKVNLLPLFYNLRVQEFKEENRRERWYKKWRAWVPQNVIAQWKDALRVMGTINGIEFCKDALDWKMYVDIIVNKVCEILPIDLSHSNEAFQGKQRLCKLVIQMFERVEDLHQAESHMVDKDNSSQLMEYPGRCIHHVVRHNLVAGVHGFGGTGKSSLCKALNDHYFSEFGGRVCHIEMRSDGKPLLRLRKLLSCIQNHLCETHLHEEEQVWNLLRQYIKLSRKPIYMSIDNVAEESITEAEKYLKCGPFPKGSKIFITSRTLKILQRVTRSDKSCVWAEMPSLNFHEAKDVFLHELGCAIQQGADSMVNECVRLCTLNVDKVGFYPLRLISLARYMVANIDISDPLKWKCKVAELSADRRSGLERVFQSLGSDSQDKKSVRIDGSFRDNDPMINDAERSVRLDDDPNTYKVDQAVLHKAKFSTDRGSRLERVNRIPGSDSEDKKSVHIDVSFRDNDRMINDAKRSEPSTLRLGCPIFLSHSSSDKNFVGILHQALHCRGYKVFFDKEILPKGVPVSMANILGEIKNYCKLGVLVLSDDFFEHTRNPMLELAAFVEHKVELLPLFYKLSVEEFKEEKRRERWYKKWRAWVPENVIAQWKDALKLIGTINGIESHKEAPDLKMYVDIIANKVCEILPIHLSHNNEAFQGKQRLCEFVKQMFERVEDLHQTESHMVDKDNSSQLMDTWKHPGHRIQHVVRHNLVAGVHGFEGTGKSSLCKALNDHHSLEFKGRVCHIEMGSDGGPLSRLTKLLSCFHNELSRTRLHGEEQVWNLLRQYIRLSTRPIYLLIDNVAKESINEAQEYLKCGPFPKGSKIFITSRTLEMLQMVTRNDKCCVWVEMPSLNFHEAKNVFLHEMGCAIQKGVDSMVNQCVTLCTLNIYNVDFHPLRLISMARYMLAKIDVSDPLMWKREVAKLILDRRSGLERVFKILG